MNLFKKYLFSFIFALGIFFAFPVIVQASTFTVDSTGDGADAVIDGLCADSGGKCTLRAAIQEANATAGPHTINFNIPTSDTGYRDYDDPNSSSSGDSLANDDFWTIRPSTALPTITSSDVTIDGTTQTANQGDTNANGPEIEINGISAVIVTGLNFTGANGVVNGVIVSNFTSQIYLSANGTTITRSYINVDPKGFGHYAVKTDGIYINAVTGTIIGNTITDGNVIGKNANGINAQCGTTGVGKTITIAGNFLGINKDASYTTIPNTMAINIAGDCQVVIGGDTSANRNYISGNSGTPVQVILTVNSTIPKFEFYNNFVGTDPTGLLDRRNTDVNFGGIAQPNNSLNTLYSADYQYVVGGILGKGNFFSFANARHIFFGTNPRKTLIAYNTFTRSDNISVTLSSITLNDSQSWVHHNFFGQSNADPYFSLPTGINSGSTGILVIANGTNGVLVEDNHFVGSGSGACLSEFGGVANRPLVIFQDNLVEDCYIGFWVYTSQTTIQNNIIRNSITDGIQIPTTTQTISNHTIINNEVYNSGGAGINLQTATGSRVGFNWQGNLLYGNNTTDPTQTEIKIALGIGSIDSSGVIANDAGDADTGINNQQNWPEIQSVTPLAGNQFTVSGRIDGNTAEDPFTIEVCGSNNDASGHGGCVLSYGTTTTASTPDLVSGSSNYYNWSKTVTLVEEATGGLVFTAIATNSLGSSSQFGNNFEVPTDANPFFEDDVYKIIVDSTGDQDNVSSSGVDDGNGFYSGGGTFGASGAADGKTTLREALIVANNFDPGEELIIEFNIPTSDAGYRDFDLESTPSSGDDTDGDDFWTIIPGSVLPTITASDVTIDGSTQTTNQGDRNTSGPEIQINGDSTISESGLIFSGDNGKVNSLVVNRFDNTSPGHFAIVSSGDGFVLTNSYIGTDIKGLAGFYSIFGQQGVLLSGSNGTIGTSTADGNVIAGNTGFAINASCGSSGAKTINIAGNIIGLGADGTTTITNEQNGIFILGDCAAIIGGDSALNRNIISGHTGSAILLNPSNSTVPNIQIYNNFFGSDITGGVNKPNMNSIISLTSYNGAQNQIVIGAEGKGNFFRAVTGNSFFDFPNGASHLRFQNGQRNFNIGYNTITGASRYGIQLDAVTAAAYDIDIHHNFIGASSSDPYFGINTLANKAGGIFVDSINGIEITNNTISGNDAIHFTGPSRAIQLSNSLNSVISGNIISENLDAVFITAGSAGTLLSGNEIYGNISAGITLSGSSDNITLEANEIYDNAGIAINISGGTEDSNLVTSNDAGDADTGTNDLMNWPTINEVVYLGGGMYRVSGDIDGKVSEAPFTIEICESEGHVSGHGGCLQSLGKVAANSPWEAVVTVPGSDGSNDIVFAAISTNSQGSTSEFGANFDSYTILNYPITLTYPINAAEITDRTPLLDWTVTGDPDIDHYDIYLNHSSSSNLVKIGEIDESRTNFQISEELPLDHTTYYWQVVGIRENGTEGGRSEIESFKVVRSLSDLKLIYPIGGIEIDERKPVFSWSQSTNPETKYYEIYLKKEGKMEVMLGRTEGIENTIFLPTEDLELTNYSWRVVSYYIDGEVSGESVTETFRVIDPENVPLPQTGNDEENPPVIEGEKDDNWGEIMYFLVLISPVLIAAVLSVATAFATGIWQELIRRTGIFIGALVPKKRKYWGIVYDEVESKSIAFAVIRLIKDGIVRVVTVSDVRGRYGLLVDEIGEYELSVESSGFKSYRSVVVIKDINQEVIQDVKMQRIDGNLNVVNRVRFYGKSEILNILNILWSLSMVIGLIITLRETINNPVILNFMIVGMYLFILLINVAFLLLSRVRKLGKIIEEGTNQPLSNASIRFYDASRQLDIAMTNKEGTIKINMKEGEYTVNVYKEGYVQTEDSKEMEIDKAGHLKGDIRLRKQSFNVESNIFNNDTNF